MTFQFPIICGKKKRQDDAPVITEQEAPAPTSSQKDEELKNVSLLENEDKALSPVSPSADNVEIVQQASMEPAVVASEVKLDVAVSTSAKPIEQVVPTWKKVILYVSAAICIAIMTAITIFFY